MIAECLRVGLVGGGGEVVVAALGLEWKMNSPVVLELRSRQGPSRRRPAGHCAACLRQSGPRSGG